MIKDSIIKAGEQVENLRKVRQLNTFSVNRKVDKLLPICAQAVKKHLFECYLPETHQVVHDLLTAWKPDLVQWAVFGYRGYFSGAVKQNFASVLAQLRVGSFTSHGIACGIAVIAGLAVGDGWTPDDDIRICINNKFKFIAHVAVKVSQSQSVPGTTSVNPTLSTPELPSPTS